MPKAEAKGSSQAKANLIYLDFNDDPKNMNWEESYEAFMELLDVDPSNAHRGLQFLYRKNHPRASMQMMYYHLEQAIKHKNTNAMLSLSEFDLRIHPQKYRDPKRAEKNLKRAYALNDFDAGYMLALEYRDGSKLAKDIPTYQAMIKRMAIFLHPGSMGELAYMYEISKGVEQNQAKAQALFTEAAKFGDPYSQSMIAYHLLFGPEASRNYDAGITYLKAQAGEGSVKAMTTLAKHYARGEIEDPDKLAVKWLGEAAVLGDKRSQEQLGMGMMETGYIEAMQPYINFLETAQQQGDLDASYLLARHYRAASGVSRDLAKALSILNKVKHLEDPRIAKEIKVLKGYIAHFGGIEAVPKIINH